MSQVPRRVQAKLDLAARVNKACANDATLADLATAIRHYERLRKDFMSMQARRRGELLAKEGFDTGELDRRAEELRAMGFTVTGTAPNMEVPVSTLQDRIAAQQAAKAAQEAAERLEAEVPQWAHQCHTTSP